MIASHSHEREQVIYLRGCSIAPCPSRFLSIHVLRRKDAFPSTKVFGSRCSLFLYLIFATLSSTVDIVHSRSSTSSLVISLVSNIIRNMYLSTFYSINADYELYFCPERITKIGFVGF